jgi:type II secretory pathway component GspD/PulD (secretin)
MKWNCDESATRLRFAGVFAGITLAMGMFVPMAGAQAQGAEQKTAELRAMEQSSQIFYLSHAYQQRELNDIQTDLRNMIPRAKIYGVQTQNAISIQGSAEDMALAQKMIAELDKPRKVYRLTYTITEMDGGKRVGAEHFVLVVAEGAQAILKQGSRVPIVTGSYDAGTPTQNTQVQYQDVGLSIEATLDGESLHSKVVQTSPAEEKSGVGMQDPIVLQTVLDTTANLMPGNAVVLGSLDVSGGTRHEEIAVASELVR